VNYIGIDSLQRWGIQGHFLPCVSNPHFSSADPLTGQAGPCCLSATALINPTAGRPPWGGDRERDYRDLLAKYQGRGPTEPTSGNETDSAKTLAECQFARLRGYLINRKPDATAGYSIQIFRLSDAELRARFCRE
jgi:hypothetical protein